MRTVRLAVMVLTLTVSAQAHAGVDLPTWLREASTLYPKTPQGQALNQIVRSSEFSRQAALKESPFTVQSTWSRTGLQDPGEAYPYRKTLDWSLANQLVYQPRIGLEATLGVNTNFLDTSTGSMSDPFNRPYSLSTRLAYDVLQGGTSGREKTREKANVQSALQSKHSSQAELLNSNIDFVGQMINFYASECKIGQLSAARSSVAKTVESGRIQVKTRTLSYKDFLTFLDLENSFARRLASEEATRAVYFEQLLSYGSDVQKAANQLKERKPLCEPELQSVLDRAEKSRMAEAELRRVAAFLPSYQAADDAKKVAQYQLRLSRLGNWASLSPFVGGDYTRQEGSPDSLWSYTLGIGLEWNIAGPRGRLSVSAAEHELSSAAYRLQQALLSSTSLLRNLQSQLQAQKNVLLVLKASLENSRKLLETLNAQFAIGNVDSLNLTSASINSIDASNALVDSWGTLEKTMYQTALYRSWEKPEGGTPAN